MGRAAVIFVSMCVFAVLPRTVEARGGHYRGPNGAVPPGLREPSDPTPPPPPPPRSPAVTARPTLPVPPPTSPMPPPPPSTARPSPGLPRPGLLSFENWTFWFHHAEEALEARCGLLASRPEASKISAEARARGLAALLTLAQDGSAHQALRGGALIALGKSARTTAHVVCLLGVLRSRDTPLIAAESAALGLGLLRRSGKDNPFGPDTYDRARAALLATLEDDAIQVRTRAFAALALGLLGDQATGTEGWSAEATTKRLFAVFEVPPHNVDLRIGILRALAFQPQASFTAGQRKALRTLALEGTLGEQPVHQIVQAQGLLTLGRVGGAEDVEPLGELMVSRRVKSTLVTRSTALALGTLLPRLEPEARRAALGHLMRAAFGGVKDDTLKNFSTVALATGVLSGDAAAASALLAEPGALEALVALAAYGGYNQRPHAALALGALLAVQGRGAAVVAGDFRQRSLAVLRRGLDGQDPRNRAGFALALGIAGDGESRAWMREVAADRRQDAELRGYAALALAYLGAPAPEDVPVLVAGLEDRRNDVQRILSSRALGVLRAEGSVPVLRAELAGARGVFTRGAAAVALGRVGTAEALEALLGLAEDPKEDLFTRAAACAGLGHLLDPEEVPSLGRIRAFLNYRASTDLVNELLSVL